MKRIGAVAAVLTAVAAAGASAQTAGSITVSTTPDAQTCVVGTGARVAALREATAGAVFTTTGDESGHIVIRATEAGDKAAAERGAVTFARVASPGTLTESHDGNVTKFTVQRAADGSITVLNADGTPADVKVKELAATLDERKAGMMLRKAEGGAAVYTVEADGKESPKYHVKRPNGKATVVEGKALRATTVEGAAAGEMRAHVLAADGVAMAKPVECRVIVRDGGNN